MCPDECVEEGAAAGTPPIDRFTARQRPLLSEGDLCTRRCQRPRLIENRRYQHVGATQFQPFEDPQPPPSSGCLFISIL